MPIDVESVRAATPGCGNAVHLNSAGSSLPPSVVLEAVIDYLRAEAVVGGYEIADDRAEALDSVYLRASELFGGDPENWAFVESATRGWNAAFSALRFEPGDRVLTTQAEYPSNMGGLLRARELDDVEIVIVPDDEHGQVDVAALKTLLDERTRLVSLTHVPTQGGLVNPAERVGAILRNTNTLFQLDACQSVGQMPINIDAIGCDIMSFTGRKFLRGPRGTGMVWASDAALEQMGNPAGVDMQGSTWEEPLKITPHAKAGRFEPYEVFFAGKIGLGTAMQYLAEIGIDEIAARNTELSSHLRQRLAELPRVTVRDKGIDTSAIITFTVDGHDADEVRNTLRSMSINVSVSTESSARLDFPLRNVQKVVRSSVHYYNTIDEIDVLVDAVASL